MKHRRRELICPDLTMENLRRRGQVIAQELNGIFGTVIDPTCVCLYVYYATLITVVMYTLK